ncbi:hypothetical protein B566_EDAN010272 [Ephemera danica]|nr:hypothetical protein B566_EDAN010272 [Ephemera danica]
MEVRVHLRAIHLSPLQRRARLKLQFSAANPVVCVTCIENEGLYSFFCMYLCSSPSSHNHVKSPYLKKSHLFVVFYIIYY